MKLLDMVRPSLIFPDLGAGPKDIALRTMVARLAGEVPDVAEDELLAAVLQRERLSSTGIGSGIAIPHARLAKIKEHVLAVGRSPVGIEFGAIDGKPVRLIFLIVGPSGANENHLKALARISKFLHDTHFRDRLIAAEDARAMYGIVAEKDAQY